MDRSNSHHEHLVIKATLKAKLAQFFNSCSRTCANLGSSLFKSLGIKFSSKHGVCLSIKAYWMALDIFSLIDVDAMFFTRWRRVQISHYGKDRLLSQSWAVSQIRLSQTSAKSLPGLCWIASIVETQSVRFRIYCFTAVFKPRYDCVSVSWL